jgi:oxygen-independent coproporphyrinogen-3 oxidase
MATLYRRKALNLSRQHFINNYPPFNVARPYDPDTLSEKADLLLYVHIPFCSTICTYCYYKKFANPTQDQVDKYLGYLEREIALFSQDARLQYKTIRSLYIGGGTPTILNSRQLERLLACLRQHLDLENMTELCCEAKPDERTLTAEKMTVLKELGVTRLSFGVESLNSDVLRSHNRRCTLDLYAQTYRLASDIGFPKINIDIMSGLPGETWESWGHLLDTLLDWMPPSLSIYKTEVFYNTPLFATLRNRTVKPALMSDQSEIEQVRYAHERLQREGGYIVANCLHLLRDRKYGELHYKSLWQGTELKGLGLSSHSSYEGVLHQNANELREYYKWVDEGRLPIRRGYRMTARDRLSQAMVYGLKNLEIGRSDFIDRFGVDLADLYGELIAELAAAGVLVLDEEYLRITPEYRIFADDICRQFFLPEYDYMMMAHIARPPVHATPPERQTVAANG